MIRILRRVTFALGFVAVAPPVWADFPAGNPLTATIPQTFWSVGLEDVVSLPQSNGQAPRLEYLATGGAPGMSYVIDQRGKIYRLDLQSDSPTPALFLDVPAVVPNFHVQNQTGVRGLAFHPDFNSPQAAGYRKFYTSHSRNAFAPGVGNPVFFPSPPGLHHDSVVGEWTVLANGSVDPASYREVLRIGQPFSDHNIGQISFNPNTTADDSDYGKLYVALGDGGNNGPISTPDPFDLAQDLDTPHGSILRINPLASGGAPYSVPDDNPFRMSSDESTSRNLIWAYGLRNPHHFSWDTVTGKMLIGDIGQANIEELNLGASGANYGWDVREGTFLDPDDVVNGHNLIDPLPADHPTDGFDYPVAQYDHDPNNDNSGPGSYAITTGYTYRGTAIPELTGMFLFGDFASNSNPVFAVDIDALVQRNDFTDLESLDDGLLAPFQELRLTQGGVEKTFLEIINDALPFGSRNRTDLRFGQGPDGEIYLLNKQDGIIRRLVSVSGLQGGDANRDGDVDGSDFLAWQRGVGKASPDWSDGNFDASTAADAADLAVWVAGFGSSPNAPAALVPEPASWTLSAASLLLASLGRMTGRGPGRVSC